MLIVTITTISRFYACVILCSFRDDVSESGTNTKHFTRNYEFPIVWKLVLLHPINEYSNNNILDLHFIVY